MVSHLWSVTFIYKVANSLPTLSTIAECIRFSYGIINLQDCYYIVQPCNCTALLQGCCYVRRLLQLCNFYMGRTILTHNIKYHKHIETMYIASKICYSFTKGSIPPRGHGD